MKRGGGSSDGDPVGYLFHPGVADAAPVGIRTGLPCAPAVEGGSDSRNPVVDWAVISNASSLTRSHPMAVKKAAKKTAKKAAPKKAAKKAAPKKAAAKKKAPAKKKAAKKA